MASVFLSYDRDDADKVRPIVAALEKAGHSVWWDLHVRGGAQFSKVIEEALKAADAVVVLWSANSIESAWVRDEAAVGRDSGRLVPVTIDGTKAPLGFRQFQTIDLSQWKGRGKPPELRSLLADVEAVRSPTDAAPARPQTAMTASRSFRWSWRIPAAIFAVLGALAALALWQPWASSASAVAAVVAADSSQTSRDYARDLLTKLGQLQSAKPNMLQLVGADAAKQASLRFEISGGSDDSKENSNLVLLDGKSGGLLWSKAFERPIRETGDLRQEVAYTAAQVLECAIDAQGARLATRVLKIYLNGCAGLAGSADPAEIAAFRQVVEAEPRFERAWAKLLVADADAVQRGDSAEALHRLRKDIAAARRVNPNLAEAFLAEVALLPPNAYRERIGLADRAAKLAPDQAAPLMVRSFEIFAVGKVTGSVDDARRAVELDPVSPRARENYITILADSGRTVTALRELAVADKLWPGASNLAWTRFRINMRYGDPRVAREIIRSGKIAAGWSQAESYLEARLDPTTSNARRAIDDAWAAYRHESFAYNHLVQALGQFGTVDELLTFLNQAPFEQASDVVGYMFQPMFARFWHDPRSLTYAKRVGLLQYWESSGSWPDFCYERGFPYDCKKEAAKLTA